MSRIGILLAAIAVPVMAAPGDFGAIAADAAPDRAALLHSADAQTTMPFEQPGMSFPGSAFYYLADPPELALVALPNSNPLEEGAEGGREVGELIDAGAPARPFYSAGAGASHSRAAQCLAQAVWYEAASESAAGQRAVAQVVLNRVAHPAWPGSVCGVVFQGSQRSTGCQFSFTCDGSMKRRAKGASWAAAQRVASAALAGKVYAPIGHATHYHTLWVNPYWAKSLDHVGTIGAHRFYRKRGSAGESAAFSNTYAGAEPQVTGGSASVSVAASAAQAPAPARIDAARVLQTPDSPANDPRAYGSGQSNTARYAGQAPTQGQPATPLADPELSNSGQARAEYANAGQWKREFPTDQELAPTPAPTPAPAPSGN